MLKAAQMSKVQNDRDVNSIISDIENGVNVAARSGETKAVVKIGRYRVESKQDNEKVIESYFKKLGYKCSVCNNHVSQYCIVHISWQ